MANEAAEAYKKAIQICVEKPTSASCKDAAGYHNNLGQAYALTGHTAEAIQEYNTAAQVNPAGAVYSRFPAGARVGTLTLESGNQRADVPLIIEAPISGPDLAWRLTRGF